MAVTDITTLTNQINKIWSHQWKGSLVQGPSPIVPVLSREFTDNVGQPTQIMQMGDTVYVSRLDNLSGSDKSTSDPDFNEMQAEELSLSRVAVTANRMASSTIEIQNLAKLQTELDANDTQIRDAMFAAVQRKIAQQCYGLVSPSASAPDHDISSSDFNAATLSSVKILADRSYWPDGQQDRWLFVDPQFHQDIVDDTTLAGADYGASDVPIIQGRLSLPRMGFNILMDNTIGSPTGPAGITDDYGLAFTREWAYLVLQQQPEFRIHDRGAAGKRTYYLDLTVVYGVKLGHQGDIRHIRIT